MLNSHESVLKKFKFHSSFISVLENTVSDLIFFEHTLYNENRIYHMEEDQVNFCLYFLLVMIKILIVFILW